MPEQIPDLREEPSSPVNELILGAGYRARLLVPLLGADRIVGALVVRRKAPGEFSKGTVELLQTFAAQSVLAIQNARLFSEIGEKSRQLELASQHKSQFLANMSHELRTPLNAILGYTELILDDIYGEAPTKMRSVLERVQRNGKHLLGLINDVLDLSKIEAGQLTLSLADYSIKEVVHSVFTAVEPLASRKEARVQGRVAAEPADPAHGDERRMTQVLLNLVGNAIKFTDTGEVAISASAANGSFTISVRDTGPGIVRGRSGQDLRGVPAGRQLVHQEEGRHRARACRSRSGSSRCTAARSGSNPRLGEGSTFSFTLPVRSNNRQDTHEQAHSGGRGPGGQSADPARSARAAPATRSIEAWDGEAGADGGGVGSGRT